MSDVLFPGCTVQARLPFIESAFKFILKELGKEMENLQGSTCCMEPVGLRSLSQDAWLAVNARLHSIASGRRLVTLCEGCNISLSESSKILKEGGEKAKETISRLGYRQSISDVSGSLQFLHENLDALKEKIKKPMEMKIAVFPGCHCEYVCSKKGSSATQMMIEVLNAVGSNPIEPTSVDLCCGGGVTGIDQELDKKILSETISSFRDTGANAVAVACPFCFMRFDMVAKFKTYHIVELVAIALGYEDTMKYHTSRLDYSHSLNCLQ